MSWTTDKIRIFTPALESGTISSGNPMDAETKVRTADFSTIYISECQIVFDNQNLYCNVFQYTLDGTYKASSGYKKGNYTFKLTESRKIKVVFSKTNSSSGTQALDVSEVTGFQIVADYGDIQWSQDDEQFFGFPFLTNTGTTNEFNGKNSVWSMSANLFFGFPYIKKAMLVPKYKTVEGHYIRRPLMVYNAFQLDFSKNGYQVLAPTKAEHSLEFGTFGEIVVEHPIDKAGAWKALKPNEIILAPCIKRWKDDPQPFRIYRIITKMGANGEKTVTAYARHILYDMNEVLLVDVRPTNKNGMDAIAWLYAGAFEKNFGNSPVRYISFYSDIDTISSAEYQRVNLTNALIGADNCIMNRWGGELYGSGLYFSICRKMEFSRENAFSVRYAVEMTEVSEEIDYTDYCTYLHAVDNLGDYYDWSYTTEDPIPHVRMVAFNYTSYEEARASLGADSASYWGTVSTPKVSYTFKFVEMTRWERLQYEDLQSCEVGDTGHIYNPILDIDTIQRVSSKRVDLLTGETLEVKTGEQSSFVRKQAWSDTVSTGAPSAVEKQLDAEMLSNLTTWGSAVRYSWGQVQKFAWGQAGE